MYKTYYLFSCRWCLVSTRFGEPLVLTDKELLFQGILQASQLVVLKDQGLSYVISFFCHILLYSWEVFETKAYI